MNQAAESSIKHDALDPRPLPSQAREPSTGHILPSAPRVSAMKRGRKSEPRLPPGRSRAHRFAIWGLGALLLTSPAVAQEDEASLFELYFGKKRASGANFVVDGTFVLNERTIGFIPLRNPDSDATVEISSFPLLSTLSLHTTQEYCARIVRECEGKSWVTSSELRDLGIGSTFDENSLVLEITVPPGDRAISLHGRKRKRGSSGFIGDAEAEKNLAPFQPSGYINVLGSVSHERNDATGTSERSPFIVFTEGMFDFGTFHTQADILLQEGWDSGVEISNFRLMRDDSAGMDLVSLGQVEFPTLGAQSHRYLLGLCVDRTADFRPDMFRSPEKSIGWVLLEPSEVKVFIDGVVVRHFRRLDPGPHRLRGIKLPVGRHEIELQITGRSGVVENRSHEVFASANMLQPGSVESAFAVGLPRGSDIRDVNYRIPGILYRRRTGITTAATSGWGILASPDGLQLDGEITATHGIGDLTVNAATIARIQTMPGAMLQVSQQIRNRGGRSMSFGGQIETRSWEQSTRSTQTDNRLPVGYRIHANGGIMPIEGIRINLRASGGQGQSDSRSFDRSLGGSISTRVFGAYAGLTADTSVIGGQKRPTTLFLTLSFSNSQSLRIPGTAQSIHLGLNLPTPSVSAGWSRTAVGGATRFQPRLGIRANQQTVQGSFGLDHKSPWTKFSTSGSIANRGEGAAINTQYTLSSALVFAGHTLALSTPISRGGFVILTPHDNLKAYKSGVGGGLGDEIHYPVVLGRAVVPDLVSYTQRTVTPLAVDLPVGLDLPPIGFDVKPGLMNGYRYTFGATASCVVSGILLDPQGEPVRLEGLTVSRADAAQEGHKQEELKYSVAGRTGKFIIDDVQPAQYIISMITDPSLSALILVPEGTTGWYDIGTVALAPSSQ